MATEDRPRWKKAVLLLPVGVILGIVGALFLIYNLALASQAGADPSPLGMGVWAGAVALLVGIGAVIWTVVSHRRNR